MSACHNPIYRLAALALAALPAAATAAPARPAPRPVTGIMRRQAGGGRLAAPGSAARPSAIPSLPPANAPGPAAAPAAPAAPAPAPSGTGAPAPATGAPVGYKIQPGDILSIRVTGEPDLTRSFSVDDQGNTDLPTVGSIHFAGMTVPDAQAELTTQLKKYIKLFEASIVVAQQTGPKVVVFGEVSKPGTYRLPAGARLLDALSEAGQATQAGDSSKISLSRRNSIEVRTFDLMALLRDSQENPALENGDLVTVPRKVVAAVRVDGEVRNAGLLPLDTVRTAYSALLAAGPSDRLDWTRVRLQRKDSGIPLTLDLAAARAGKSELDFPLADGDHLIALAVAPQKIFLSGEVKNPGEREISEGMTIGDAIAASGGYTDTADRSRVELYRAGSLLTTVNLDPASGDQRLAAATKLAAGDRITVPNDEKNRFQILGGVRKPGSYAVRPGMTLLDALSRAEGLSERFNAKDKDFILLPADPKGDDRLKAVPAPKPEKKVSRRKTPPAPPAPLGHIQINYKAIESGDVQFNVPIRPGDRILVPELPPAGTRKTPFWEKVIRAAPLAALLLGGI
jgi:protein involved in polysaccharide export with SLBB domain